MTAHARVAKAQPESNLVVGGASAPSMFLLSDELFVGEAFRRILGRSPDPKGYRSYLTELRRGLSRARLVRALHASAEAQQRADSALNDEARSTAYVTALLDLRLGSVPGLLRQRPAVIARDTEELLALPASLLVEAAAAAMLPAPMTPDELEELQARLHAGETPEALIDGLSARPSARRLPRRAWWWWVQRWLASQPHPRRPDVPSGPAAPLPQRPPPHSVDTGTAHGPARSPNAVDGEHVVFTIASRNYLPYVRTLMESIAALHPEVARAVLIVDEPDAAYDDALPGCSVVHACELGLPGFDDMTVRYDVLELNTALKPYFFTWLLQQYPNLRTVVYLDPDTRLYAPMHVLYKVLSDGASLVLTPHITKPLPPGRGLPDDHQFLRTGVYNLGFAAVRRTAEAAAYLQWWSERLATDCRVDFADNLFTDQRWCDLAPCLVEHLHVLRDPGYNVAYWNLDHRHLARASDGTWSVEGRPLVLHHFSGVDPNAPDALSRHQSRHQLEHLPAVRELQREYVADLRRHGWPVRSPYSYGSLDGIPVAPILRRLFQSRHPEVQLGASRRVLLTALFDACMPVGPEPDGTPGWSVVMDFLHRTRADLREAFDLSTTTGREAYAGWFYAAGIHEHGLAATLARLLDSAAATPGTARASDQRRPAHSTSA